MESFLFETLWINSNNNNGIEKWYNSFWGMREARKINYFGFTLNNNWNFFFEMCVLYNFTISFILSLFQVWLILNLLSISLERRFVFDTRAHLERRNKMNPKLKSKIFRERTTEDWLRRCIKNCTIILNEKCVSCFQNSITGQLINRINHFIAQVPFDNEIFNFSFYAFICI